MLITLRGELPAPDGNVTGTVGLSNVVVMLYTGMGLCGFVLFSQTCSFRPRMRQETYVSALTSQMTDKRRFGDERLSTLVNGGILAER